MLHPPPTGLFNAVRISPRSPENHPAETRFSQSKASASGSATQPAEDNDDCDC